MSEFESKFTGSRRSFIRTAALLPASALAQSTSSATITVDPKTVGGAVSPLLFGCGIEWAENGNNIYDPQARRNRPEVVAALKRLGLTTLRFPGGIMADYYDWRDGVGELSSRPKRANPMDGKQYANNFGTDEFIDLCRQLGAEPLITLNAGTGTLDMALGWQKYLRGKGMAVKYFEVGNELYLAEPRRPATIAGNDSRIYKTAAQYSALFKQWAQALKSADGACLVGAVAGTYNTSRDNQGWLDKLLADAGRYIDFLALHDAFAPIAAPSYAWTDESKRAEAYRAMYTANTYSAEDMRVVSARLLAANAASNGRLAITEHFPLFGGGGTQSQLLQILDQSRTVAAGIYTASLLQNMMRRKVWMADFNLALSPWFGALLQDTPQGLIENPHYSAFQLLRELAGASLLKTDVTSPTFNSSAVGVVAAGSNMPVLDVVSASKPGALLLSVVNRSLYQATPAAIRIPLTGYNTKATVKTFNGPVPHAIKGAPLSSSVADRSSAVATTSGTWTATGSNSYTFPPLSVTLMSWPKA